MIDGSNRLDLTLSWGDGDIRVHVVGESDPQIPIQTMIRPLGWNEFLRRIYYVCLLFRT
jgi:hypothetical protein